MFPLRRRRKAQVTIDPDEILLDASNISEFDRDQFEGRLEKPLSRKTFFWAGVFLCLVFVGLLVRVGNLDLVRGALFAKQAEENKLEQKIVFADRGAIVDRRGFPLASNARASVDDDFAARTYSGLVGLSHVVGYVKSPAKDSSGHYFRNAFVGLDGAERAFNTQLGGQNGLSLTETDSRGRVVAESVVNSPVPGAIITLSIDARVNSALYEALAARAEESSFQGGAAVVMDVHTGEILALASYPEYSSQAVSDGDSAALKALNRNPRQPFLNRVTGGLYAPGSIVKPIVGAAALTEGIIDQNKQILSTGSISVPNPYDKAHPSVFKDWRANGWVDVRRAIAVSSDVYFYEVGGGFEGQPGLGIDRLDKYFKMFGFSSDPGLAGFSEQDGNIPTPAWKAKAFPKDPVWRVGDTYHTAIGQYGMQLTPLQAVREAAAIANDGILLTPQLVASSTPKSTQIPITPAIFQIIREGMRMGVVDGIATAVKFDSVHVAAKTGTAQIGVHNEFVNSWMIGFFPYEHPRYAYAMVLERGPQHTTMGSPAAMGQFLSWLQQNAPYYTK